MVTDHTNSMVEALRKNERVFINLEPSIADGLSVNKVGVNTFFNLKGVVDKMVTTLNIRKAIYNFLCKLHAARY